MANFHALAGSATLQVRTAAGNFCRSHRFFTQPDGHVDAIEFLVVEGVVILNGAGAKCHGRTDLNPRVNTGHRMFGAARIDGVAHPYHDGVEVAVNAGHWAFEQQPPRVRLYLVIGELRQRGIVDDD